MDSLRNKALDNFDVLAIIPSSSVVVSFLLLMVFCTPCTGQAQFQWATQAGSIGDEEGRAISVDASGNAYITGKTDHGTVFDSIVLQTPGAFNSGFVAKYDSFGNVVWAKSLMGTETFDISTDSAGNSYISGTLADSLFIGNDTVVPIGRDDGFIAAFDENGNYRWAKAFGPDNNVLFEKANAITIDDNRHLYVTGIGETGYYLAKFDTAGTNLWTDPITAVYGSEGFSVDVDGQGNIYTAGSFTQSASIGGIQLISPHGGRAPFIAKHDPQGNVLWAKAAASPEYNHGAAVAVHPDGGVVTSGRAFAVKSHDIFISRYASNGSLQWSVEWGKQEEEEGSSALAVGQDGTIFIAGFAKGDSIMNAFNIDLLLLALDSTGNEKWHFTTGGNTDQPLLPEVCNGMVLVKDELYLTGTFKGTAPFGADTLSAFGTRDIFLAKLSVNAQTVLEELPLNSLFQVFPNPGADEVEARFGPDLEGKHLNIQVIDLQGAVIGEYEVAKGKHTQLLNTTEWKPGVYVVISYVDGEAIGYQKLVIQR